MTIAFTYHKVADAAYVRLRDATGSANVVRTEVADLEIENGASTSTSMPMAG
jgi:hypothetical protein